jgi:hypothetical protein
MITKRNLHLCYGICAFTDATFNNITAIPWWSVLLADETGVPEEKRTNSLSQVTDKHYNL